MRLVRAQNCSSLPLRTMPPVQEKEASEAVHLQDEQIQQKNQSSAISGSIAPRPSNSTGEFPRVSSSRCYAPSHQAGPSVTEGEGEQRLGFGEKKRYGCDEKHERKAGTKRSFTNYGSPDASDCKRPSRGYDCVKPGYGAGDENILAFSEPKGSKEYGGSPGSKSTEKRYRSLREALDISSTIGLGQSLKSLHNEEEVNHDLVQVPLNRVSKSKDIDVIKPDGKKTDSKDKINSEGCLASEQHYGKPSHDDLLHTEHDFDQKMLAMGHPNCDRNNINSADVEMLDDITQGGDMVPAAAEMKIINREDDGKGMGFLVCGTRFDMKDKFPDVSGCFPTAGTAKDIAVFPEKQDVSNSDQAQRNKQSIVRSAHPSPKVLVDVTNKFQIKAAPAVKEQAEENDVHRLSQRHKQIEFGKNTLGYERYNELIPRLKRKSKDPHTPNPKQVCSKRSWDGQIRKWRRLLHNYDPPVEDGEEMAEDFSALKSREEHGKIQNEKDDVDAKIASDELPCRPLQSQENTVGSGDVSKDIELSIYEDWMES